jgi:hypothetical protein
MKRMAEEGAGGSGYRNNKENGEGNAIGNGEGVGNESGPEQAPSGGDVTSFTTSELPVPKSMANRNKKRGFMKEMSNVQGTKIVFGSDAQGSSTPVADVPIKDINDSTTFLTPQATGNSTTTRERRVLPPSEMDLPSNVFVTHQVYDRRGWTPRGRAARHRAEAAAVEEEESEDEEEQEMDLDVEEDEQKAVKENPIPVPSELPNGAVDVFSPAKGYGDEHNWWSKAEDRFDELPIIDLQTPPAKESIIAWKVGPASCLYQKRHVDDQELQLCTYSFTPQLKVQLGEVAEINGGRMVVNRLERYDADEDDPFNGQPAELVVEGQGWGAKGIYRHIADPIEV